MNEISVHRRTPIPNEELNALFAAAWPGHQPRDFGPMLQRSLAYFTAHCGNGLVGFVNVAWDGGAHGFILDTTVHPDFRRRRIGLSLLSAAKAEAIQAGLEWLHVDYEPELEPFYRAGGFRRTTAGVWRVDWKPATD